MSATQAVKKRIQKLRKEIAELDRLYFQQNRPAMADMEYDFLKKELEKLERENQKIVEELGEASPTDALGSDLSGELPTARHLQAMYSLDNSYSKDELEDFDARLRRALKTEREMEYTVEPKIDGLGISVVYEKGRLARAVTRGDGEEGEVVTKNFLTIKGVPHEWPAPAPEVVELRGEVYLTYGQFQKINERQMEAGLEEYANPRNLAAGTLKLKDNPEEAARRGLRAIFYGLGEYKGPKAFNDHAGFLEFLKKYGWPTQEKWWVCKGIAEAWKAIEELDGLRKSFTYPTDGAVIKLNDYALREVAGFTARAPRWAFAYKYQPERAQTLLEKITVQVGRTGVLTPVAELAPVELSGSTVARATLHNADEIARKDVREGDTVIIEKAGEVIPAVISVVLEKRPKDSLPFSFPNKCPSCGEKVVKIEGEVAYRCVNPECPAQRKRALEHFASRNAMAIDHLGEAVVEQLTDKGLVKSVADIYDLTLEDLLPLEGFAKKSAENLYNSIQGSRKNDLWRLIHGLGIPQVGEAVSQLLAGEFETLEVLEDTTQERLLEIFGIGESMADSIVKFFQNPERKKMIEQLKRHGVNMKSLSPKKPSTGPLAGRKFVLTGELKNYTRSQAKEKIESLGGKVVDKMSKSVEAVIIGENPGSKLSDAKKLGVKILDEEEFEGLLD